MTQQRIATRVRRQSILLAALDCFSKSDIESVSIADICKRSGASVGSVYHHFGNKNGIVLALLADGLEAHLLSLDKALDVAGSNPHRCVEAVIGSLIDWVETYPRWASFIYSNLNRSGAVSAEAIIAVNRRYEETIDQSFGPLVASGQIRELPQDCWSSLILAPVHDYSRKWLRKRSKDSPSVKRKVFIEAAWRILQPEAGD